MITKDSEYDMNLGGKPHFERSESDFESGKYYVEESPWERQVEVTW